MMRKNLMFLMTAALVASSTAFAAPREVGDVEFAKGQVSAQHPAMGSRALAIKSVVYGQDLVETGDKSFSVLRFQDQGKVSVRPLSRFQVSSYNLERHEAAFRLDKGGVTLETAAVGRDRPQQMEVDTPLAQVNAQQAVVQVLVCREGCAQPGREGGASAEVSSDVVARVVQRTGSVSAQSPGGPMRNLSLGAPLYQTDRLTSGGDGQLLAVFRDGGRISLGANSEAAISEYRYGKGGGDKSSLELVKGSLRTLTGRLGKDSPEGYAINTPVAIIGVRGTAMDLLYPADRQGRMGAGGGLLSHVREGAINQKNAAGRFDLGAPKVNFIASQQQAPAGLATPPKAMLRALGPKPESTRINMEQLFGVRKLSGMPSGVYVYAADGHVKLTGTKGGHKGTVLELGRNEAAYVDEDGLMMRIERPLLFQVGELPLATQTAGEAVERPDLNLVPPVQSISVPFDEHTHSYWGPYPSSW